jgi:malonyl CoA-acyl carrier protein transacylase
MFNSPMKASAIPDQSAKALVQFGGQGGRYFEELKTNLAASRAVESLLMRAMEPLMDQATRDDIRGSGLLSRPLDVLAWFEKDCCPTPEVLASSLVSHPLIFLTQASQIIRAREQGLPISSAQAAIGATGHSQGILAATLLAQDLDGRDFEDAAIGYATWLLRQGFRTQQAFPARPLTSYQLRHWEKHQEGRPSPMASLQGVSRAEIEQRLEDFNACMPEDCQLYLSLVNGPDRIVLSGPVDSLIWFRGGLKGLPLRWRFLRVQAPLHSPYMASAVKLAVEDIAEAGLSLDASKLAIPVLRCRAGEDLRTSDNPVEDLVRDMILFPVDWPAVCHQIEALAPRVLLDLGPDIQTSTLSRENLQGSRIQAVSVNIPEENRRFFSQSRQILDARLALEASGF